MKKKSIKAAALAALLSVLAAAPAYADQCGLYINNQPVSDGCEVINGVSLIPARLTPVYFDAQITFADDGHTAVLSADGIDYTISDGSTSLTGSDGSSYQYAVAAQMKNNELYIPARSLISCFGGDIVWEDMTQTLFINSPDAYAEALQGGSYLQAKAAQCAALVNEARTLIDQGDYYGANHAMERAMALELPAQLMPGDFSRWTGIIRENIGLWEAGKPTHAQLVDDGILQAKALCGQGLYYEALSALEQVKKYYISPGQQERIQNLTSQITALLNEYKGRAYKSTAEEILYRAKALASSGDFYGGAHQLDQLRTLDLAPEYLPAGYDLWNRFINGNIYLMQSGKMNQVQETAVLLSEVEALCGQGLYYEALAKLDYMNKNCYVNLDHRRRAGQLRSLANRALKEQAAKNQK